MEFSSNTWYRLTTAASMKYQLSMAGPFPYFDGTKGSVTFSPSDNNMPSQQWQLLKIDTSTYVLRTKAAGARGYLAVDLGNGSTSAIVPQIVTAPTFDSSMYWKILPWGDGTFYFAKKSNGSLYHLNFEDVGNVTMSSNTTQPQPGQAFSFVKLGDIDDTTFSIPLSTSTTSMTSTFSTSFTPVGTPSTVFAQTPPTTFSTAYSTPILAATSSPSPSQQPRIGLSPSASLGVGTAVGVFAIVCILSLIMLLYTGYKRRQPPKTLHHRRMARAWRGFTKQHHSSHCYAKSKTIANIQISELPTPPLITITPPAPCTPGTARSPMPLLWDSPDSSPVEMPG